MDDGEDNGLPSRALPFAITKDATRSAQREDLARARLV
jgi:hypothetical protein